MGLTVIIGLVVALVAGVCIGKAWAAFQHAQDQIRRLQEQIDKLERDQPKHLPYRAAEEIENATAAIINLKLHNDMRSEVIDNALAHLQHARSAKG